MNASPNIPTWLQKSLHSSPYLKSVMQTLAKRERSRTIARNASRNRSYPSNINRAAQLPSTIPSQTDATTVDHYSVAVGCHPNNFMCNRYADVEPYDRTRVTVGSGGVDDGEGRYLNASWVRELYGGKWWIASQAPLPHTAHAFLSLIRQPITRPPTPLHPPSSSAATSRIRTVVQLTPNIEGGRKKADLYFPSLEGQSWVIPSDRGSNLPPLKVTLVRSKSIEDARCVQSTVSVVIMPSPSSSSTSLKNAATFQHMFYTSWPDHGVPQPEDRAGLLAFLRLVDKTNKDVSGSGADGIDLDPDPPIIVGCSAGIGRTGSFITLSSLLRVHNLLATDPSSIVVTPPPLTHSLPPSPIGPLPDEFKDDLVAQEIDAMREQRPGMVQREEQAQLVYKILELAFSESK